MAFGETIKACLWPPQDSLSLLIHEAHGIDHCARVEVLSNWGFWAPKFQHNVDAMIGRCETCLKNNIRKGVTKPLGLVPVSEG